MSLIDTPSTIVPPKPSERSSAARVSTVLNVNPTEDDARLVGEVRQLFQRARAHRRPLVQRWNKNYRMLRNKYWTESRPNWMPSPQIPEIFPIVASMVGWMTDQRFRHEVTPAAMPFSPFSNFMAGLGMDLETVMDSTWHVNKEENEITKMLWDANIYGTGIVKTVWDETLLHGQGDAISRRIDPYTFYPDPAARGIEDANYFIEARTMSVQELDRRFPGSAKYFADGGVTEDIDEAPTQLDNTSTFPRANPGAISPATSPRYGMPGSSRINATEITGVTVLEAWLREHELYEATYTDEDGKEVTDLRVYDTWRVVVVAGNRVLMNEQADDLWHHGSHPYDRYVPHDLGEFWGLSLVEMLSSPQEAINRILGALQQNVELVGNPVFLESTRSGIQRTQLTNKPGTRLTVNDGGKAEWLQPPQVHQMMPELLRYYLQRMEAVSGLSAVTKGGSSGGRQAQGVVDAMREAAFVRIRMALRNLEYTLRDSGYKKAALICENYTTPRIVAIVGPTGNKTSLAIKGRHFYTPGPNGSTPMKFQLLVNAGSAGHTSRKVREDQAVMLFTLGAIDEDALLEALDFPNRQVVAERVKALKSQGMMEPPGARQKAQRTH